MAGTVPTIAPGAITGISGLKTRPVYFLNLNHSATPNVVVKGDAQKTDSDVSIKWGSKLMKNVQNSLVNTKIMTPTEIAAFKQAALAAFANNTPQYDPVKPGGQPFCWVKMPYVAGLSDADFIDEDSSVNLKQVKELVKKLSDDTVWSELGRVVAVDIFNGNGDRFAVDAAGVSKPGDWINRGNIMFLARGLGHTTPVIGLDTFDPSSQVGNLNTGGGHEGLKVLTDSTKRKGFTENCVRSVARQIKLKLLQSGHHGNLKIAVQGSDGPGVITIPIDTMEHLFDPYAVNMDFGISLGANQLKQYLQRKVQQYTPAVATAPSRPSSPVPPNRGAGMFPPPRPAAPPPPAVKTIPQGILNRMAYLGW